MVMAAVQNLSHLFFYMFFFFLVVLPEVDNRMCDPLKAQTVLDTKTPSCDLSQSRRECKLAPRTQKNEDKLNLMMVQT